MKSIIKFFSLVIIVISLITSFVMSIINLTAAVAVVVAVVWLGGKILQYTGVLQ